MNQQTGLTPRPATYQDVLDAPAHMVAELVGGVLRLQPRPAMHHALAGSMLGGELGGPLHSGRSGPGGWWILHKPELHLGEDVLVPDLAGWRRERMPEFPDTAWSALAPDWACEILSPSTRAFDLTEKRDRYTAAGVDWMWLVDPAARTLEALALRDSLWVLLGALGDNAEERLAAFDAVAFLLGALWP